MTMQDIQKQFDFYNWLIFDGAVPPCEIVIKKKLHKKAMGYFYSLVDENGNKAYLIELSEAYPNQGITLVHEMVHALQYKLNKKVNHKKYFKHWQSWIQQEFGLDI